QLAQPRRLLTPHLVATWSDGEQFGEGELPTPREHLVPILVFLWPGIAVGFPHTSGLRDRLLPFGRAHLPSLLGRLFGPLRCRFRRQRQRLAQAAGADLKQIGEEGFGLLRFRRREDRGLSFLSLTAHDRRRPLAVGVLQRQGKEIEPGSK